MSGLTKCDPGDPPPLIIPPTLSFVICLSSLSFTYLSTLPLIIPPTLSLVIPHSSLMSIHSLVTFPCTCPCTCTCTFPHPFPLPFSLPLHFPSPLALSLALALSLTPFPCPFPCTCPCTFPCTFPAPGTPYDPRTITPNVIYPDVLMLPTLDVMLAPDTGGSSSGLSPTLPPPTTRL